MFRYLCGFFLLLLAWPTLGAAVDLELIMSDPDWIGNAPENPYWSDSGTEVYYSQKRTGESIRDLKRVPASGGAATTVEPAEVLASSNNSRVYNRQHDRVAWIYRGDVILKNLQTRQLSRVTGSVEPASDLQFMADGRSVSWLESGQHWIHHPGQGLTRQASDIRYQKAPDEKPDFDALRNSQNRTYATLREDKRRQAAERKHQLLLQQADPNSPPLPVYLGKGYRELSRSLSPSGRHLLLVVEGRVRDRSDKFAKDQEEGRAGVMPNYVTSDGYTAIKHVRTRVNRNATVAQLLLLVDLESSSYWQLDYSPLAGISDDPLKKLRRSAIAWHVEHGADRKEVEKQLAAPRQRSVRVDAIRWNSNGGQVLLQLAAVDNKDRWLASLQTGGGKLKQQHRLQDKAWINWDHNEFGWLPDDTGLWYLSEESGYSHLYRKDLKQRRAKQLTSGAFVVREPALASDGIYAYVVSNRTHPGNYEVYRVPLAGGELQQLTALDGVSSFSLSPDGRALLLSRSYIDRHPDLYIKTIGESARAQQLTDTVSAQFQQIDWVMPDIVKVPSTHVDRPIYSKIYLPHNYLSHNKNADQTWPAVMFVHGAGYTQNSHRGWPYYFREFMFHTLLTQAGYIVIDMDYRASKGYGREWRTAIYRQMGHPELEDFADGVAWLEQEYNVDPQRVGIYGGSYGGFMTFMALFRTPDLFAAGAALRPVVDWMHYENDYTSRILNTPEIDPVAYQRSSPIHFADGLSKPVLIASGMQDDNVFFQDSVLLVQRLIELHKQNFEMAIYPLDGHGFTHADSWLDEYRRVFKLMEQNLK